MLARLREAAKIYSSHLQSVSQKDEGHSDELVRQIQEKLGGTSEANLARITADDLRELEVPVLVARRMVEALGGSAKDAEQRQIVIVDDNPETMAMRLKPHELVAAYDPNEPDNAFGKRLAEISKGQPFLIFDAAGVLDVPSSVALLQELRDNYPPRAVMMVRSLPYKPYPVGGRPLRFADEHPLLKGKILRPDGYSDTNIEWGRVDFRIRQLLYIGAHLDPVEANPASEQMIFDAVAGGTFEDAAARFPRAALRFRELESSQGLPNLKVALKAPEVKTS